MAIKSDFNTKYFILVSSFVFVVSLLIAAVIIKWPEKYHLIAQEDGVIESAGAIFFALAALLFLISAFKYKSTKSSQSLMIIMPTLALAALSFLAFGEEISWGQRILGLSTPVEIQVDTYHQYKGMWKNMQNEINLHNMGFFYEDIGFWRITMALLIFMGIVYPMSSLVPFMRKFYQKYYIPVCPVYYISLAISGLLIEYQLKPYAYIENNTAETYEMILGLLFFAFAAHSVFKPKDVYISD